MPTGPDIKRAVSFIDGQNLYRHAKDAFSHHHSNYISPRAKRISETRDRSDRLVPYGPWAPRYVPRSEGLPAAQVIRCWIGIT